MHAFTLVRSSYRQYSESILAKLVTRRIAIKYTSYHVGARPPANLSPSCDKLAKRSSAV